MSRPSNWAQVLAGLAVGALALLWWGTAASTSDARVAALATVEPYAMAVHEQLMFNFSQHGRFFQTVHKGYTDTWLWSGHRAPSLVINAWLYGLDPGPRWLARLHALWVLAGVIPAALIGRRIGGGALGTLVGGMVYLGAPATLLLALQDYQDLSFALPAVVFAGWCMGSRGALWPALGALVLCLPREESVLLGPAVAIVVVPWMRAQGPWWRSLRARRWAWNVGAAALVAGVYSLWASTAFPVAGSGHDMPLAAAAKGLLSGEPIYLEGWLFRHDFYRLLFVPLGLLALASPASLLPALALVGLHMTVPGGHGVDRTWGGHVHHLAPAMGFVALASVEGGARLVRWARVPRLGPWSAAPAALLVLGLGFFNLSQLHSWAPHANLVVAWWPQPPAWTHPVWTLMAQVGPAEIPVASKTVSLALSARSESYTMDGSLGSKARERGLGAASVAIVDTRQSQVMEWVMAMPGAIEVAQAEPFVLVRWQPGARDGLWVKLVGTQIAKSRPYSGPYRRTDLIPGVGPRTSQKLNERSGEMPVLSLPLGP